MNQIGRRCDNLVRYDADRSKWTAVASLGLCVAALTVAPCRVVGQGPRITQWSASLGAARLESSATPVPFQPAIPRVMYRTSDDRSAARIIGIHTAVGTGAGLLLGLLLSGSSVGDDRRAVILTWTGVGAGAGVVSGVVTWLLSR
jgi:hypothetical protein